MGIRDQAPIYGISNTVEAWAIVLGALGAVASLVYCAWAARKGRSPLPLYLFLGGGLTCFAEPFIDIAGGNIFAEVDVVPWNAALGRHIPMYIGLFLLFYLAPAYVVLLAMFERGGELSLRTYYATCAVLVGSTCVFEFLPLHFDLWQYYGS